jgi:hypothetical protein
VGDRVFQSRLPTRRRICGGLALTAVGLAARPRLAEAGGERNDGPPPSAGPPPLIGQAANGVGLTLYVKVPLGGESPAAPMTGIFLPQGFRPTTKVDIILYLHGFKSRHPSLSIDGYWDNARSLFWPLREGVSEARRNVVLVAPTLGPRSEAPWLIEPGGFDRYAELLLQALKDYGPFRATGRPELRSLILACHSGGGLPMRLLARSKDRVAKLVSECWGFDSTYNRGDDAGWTGWANEHPDSRLHIYYIAGSATEPLSLKLKCEERRNIFVLPAGTSVHDRVPITHWRERITGSPSLASL